VYSSDGLPPLALPKAPVISLPHKNQRPQEKKNQEQRPQRQQQQNQQQTEKTKGSTTAAGSPAPPSSSSSSSSSHLPEEDAFDDESSMNPAAAFEVFQGKLFVSEPARSNHGGRTTTRMMTTTSSTAETPLQRLTRLRMEVKEVEEDLKGSLLVGNPNEESNEDDDDEDNRRLFSDMTRVAHDLAKRLDDVAATGSTGGEGGDGIITGSKKLQEGLSEIVKDGVSQMKQNRNENEDKDVVVAVSGTDAVTTKDEDAAAAARLEERIARIEKVMGGISEAKDGTVLSRLESAERMTKRLDGSMLDAAAARAKVIRADLEAANKARTKLTSYSTSSNTSNTSNTMEDAKTISTLHDQMTDILQISHQLPMIVHRLTQLATLHTQASNFSARLVEVEHSANQSERLLKTLEETLDRVQVSCSDNLEVMHSNFNLLDDRMDKLAFE